MNAVVKVTSHILCIAAMGLTILAIGCEVAEDQTEEDNVDTTMVTSNPTGNDTNASDTTGDPNIWKSQQLPDDVRYAVNRELSKTGHQVDWSKQAGYADIMLPTISLSTPGQSPAVITPGGVTISTIAEQMRIFKIFALDTNATQLGTLELQSTGDGQLSGSTPLQLLPGFGCQEVWFLAFVYNDVGTLIALSLDYAPLICGGDLVHLRLVMFATTIAQVVDGCLVGTPGCGV